MSTNIATINGQKESIISYHKTEYVPQSIGITRFWGGAKKGVMLQLTIGETYIQIDEKEIQRLKYILENYHDLNEED